MLFKKLPRPVTWDLLFFVNFLSSKVRLKPLGNCVSLVVEFLSGWESNINWRAGISWDSCHRLSEIKKSSFKWSKGRRNRRLLNIRLGHKTNCPEMQISSSAAMSSILPLLPLSSQAHSSSAQFNSSTRHLVDWRVDRLPSADRSKLETSILASFFVLKAKLVDNNGTFL